jgi:hypothetical protein
LAFVRLRYYDMGIHAFLAGGRRDSFSEGDLYLKSRYALLAVIGIYAVVLLAMRLSAGWLSVLQKGPDLPFGCSDEVVARVKNGSHDHFASIIERDCGATTDFVRSVYIDSASGKGPNAYEKPVAVANGQGISAIQWKDDRTLIVQCDRTTKFFHQQASIGEFKIVYSGLQDSVRQGTKP